ncbi:hypothetical protein ABK040_002965 [Willaertia magna]
MNQSKENSVDNTKLNVVDVPISPRTLWLLGWGVASTLTLLSSNLIKNLPFKLPSLNIINENLNFNELNYKRLLMLLCGGGLTILGLMIGKAGRAQMAKHQTNIPHGKPVNALCKEGIFSKSRNPLYLGVITASTGLTFSLNNWYYLLSMMPFLIYVQFFVIPKEETFLSNLFGEEYNNYKKQVPKWFLF